MLTFTARRLAEAAPVLVGVSIVVFLFLRLVPGDPAVALLGERASQENVQRLREQMGLNQPLHAQYWRFAQRLARAGQLHPDEPAGAGGGALALPGDDRAERGGTAARCGDGGRRRDRVGGVARLGGGPPGTDRLTGWHLDPGLLAGTRADLAVRGAAALAAVR